MRLWKNDCDFESGKKWKYKLITPDSKAFCSGCLPCIGRWWPRSARPAARGSRSLWCRPTGSSGPRAWCSGCASCRQGWPSSEQTGGCCCRAALWSPQSQRVECTHSFSPFSPLRRRSQSEAEWSDWWRQAKASFSLPRPSTGDHQVGSNNSSVAFHCHNRLYQDDSNR